MLTIPEQIYGVSAIWSEAKYNFVFWNQRESLDWDAEYQKTLQNVMKPMALLDYYLELSRFISLLNDGHTYVDYPKEVRSGFLTLPIKIQYTQGKHIITNTAEGCEIPLFSEILAIGGMDFDRYMKEKILPYCWNKKLTSSYKKLYAFSQLTGEGDKNAYTYIPIIEKNQAITLTTTNGEYRIKPVTRDAKWSLPGILTGKNKLKEIFRSEGLTISLTEDQIAVLTLPTFMDNDMPSNFYRHLASLKSCKGFIIDVRGNGGGNSCNADMFTQAFIRGKFEIGKVKHAVHIGAYKAWGNGKDFSQWNMKNSFNKKIYDVCKQNLFEEEITSAHYPDCPLTLEQPIVILEDAATGSSSENMLMAFLNANRATIVGMPSYGSTGNPLILSLPGGGMARICTRRYTFPNDKEFINIGIEPHIYADISQKDMTEGRDSVLDQGIEILRQNCEKSKTALF